MEHHGKLLALHLCINHFSGGHFLEFLFHFLFFLMSVCFANIILHIKLTGPYHLKLISVNIDQTQVFENYEGIVIF